MDLYFALCVVVFFVIGIVMIFFAFQGPRCIDFDESHYEEILKEGQQSHLNLKLSMPFPQNNDDDEMVPAVSLTSPYPAKPPPQNIPRPPPLGFGRILAERQRGEVLNNPYPQDEDVDVGRMPFPTAIGSFSYVDPPPNFNNKVYPSLPHANEMPPMTRNTMHYPSVSTQTGVPSCIRNDPPPPYTEATGQSQPLVRPRRNRFKKRLSQ